MVKQYSQLYLEARRALLTTEDQQTASLYARNLLCHVSGKTQEQILAALDQDAKSMEEQKTREKIIDYKRYRFRVMTTVAAAVLVVFLLPGLEGLQQQESEFIRQPMKHEMVMKNRYETKEEALSDSGMLETMLGGVNIFADNNRWNLFKE